MSQPNPRSLAEVTLVTGNRNKVEEARRILGINLKSVSVDLPEIQSLDIKEVLRAKADEAWRQLQRPLIVDETGLQLEAMNGFPGPLIKWLLEAVGTIGICRIASNENEFSATACCALMYRDEHQQLVAQADISGRITSRPRGERGFGWDPIFEPQGQDRTYAEMTAAQKDLEGHRGIVWRQLYSDLMKEL